MSHSTRDKALRRLCASLLAFASLVDIAAAAESSRPPPALEPCTLPQLARPARCGSLKVPEDSDQSGGRRISIAIVVIPAAAGPALPDPIAVLMGGPGEDAISAASLFADQFAPLLRDRDLLLVDQRGTGRSNALDCDLFAGEDPAAALRDLFPPLAAERCAKQLQARGDLTQYTFAQFANDLERVRRALGYGPLNLSAGSYGTRAAQVYLRAYPQSVRTAHLASVVPIDVPPPLTMAKSAQATLEALFVACASDAACKAAFPNLRTEFDDVLARLDAGSARVTVPDVASTVPLNRGRVMEWFRSQLYRPGTAAAVPWLIHRAYEGDWQPIADGILASARGMHSALSVGVFFSVTCSEDIPFMREEDIERETRGTFLGDYRVRQQQAACKHWPRASLPDRYRAAVQSAVPTLFVSGDTDAATPLWFTQHVARGFANHAEVVLGGRGHTEWSGCLEPIYEQFVGAGTARELDTSSCEAVPRPPFKTK
jgi:pimeloyl-ACP methyl ester carboxylesterase